GRTPAIRSAWVLPHCGGANRPVVLPHHSISHRPGSRAVDERSYWSPHPQIALDRTIRAIHRRQRAALNRERGLRHESLAGSHDLRSQGKGRSSRARSLVRRGSPAQTDSVSSLGRRHSYFGAPHDAGHGWSVAEVTLCVLLALPTIWVQQT